MATATQRKKRLSELRESAQSLKAIRLYYKHALQARQSILEQAEAKVAVAVRELEELKLRIHSAPEKILYCDRMLEQIGNELGTLADNKIQKLLRLKEQVAKLEAELGNTV